MGLNSGEVLVRAIGSDLHMDYTAVGQTTHLAARMEQLADAGAILLTPETLTLAEGFVHVTSLGPMAVKGLTAAVEVYELTGISAARSRLQAAATRGLSHFVGRDPEIEQLRRAVDQARQGRGQVAAVVGAPGVGKSRLTFELTHSPQFEGWLMLQAGAVSYGKGTSYLPVIDLLKNYFRISDRESPHEIREKVTGRLLMLDRALEATLPAVLALLDVSGDDPQWQALDPPQRRQRMLDAVKRLLLREAQLQPLLVVFEDLHWIDSETQALLDSLVESLPPARLLLFVNYRPEYEHRWGSKTSYTQLRLDPLPPDSASELLRGLLGADGTIEPLTPILIERTEGAHRRCIGSDALTRGRVVIDFQAGRVLRLGSALRASAPTLCLRPQRGCGMRDWGVMAWERGRREGARGAAGVDVDYALTAPWVTHAAQPSPWGRPVPGWTLLTTVDDGMALKACRAPFGGFSGDRHQRASSLEHASRPQDHDQEHRAEQRDDKAPEGPEGRDAERARRPVPQDGTHDADDDVREQPHLCIGLHDEAGEPSDDAADDDGHNEAHGYALLFAGRGWCRLWEPTRGP